MAVDKELTSIIVGKLGQLWEDDELSDIKLIIDDFQFNCHRFHLSACSEFFRVLLKTQTAKATNDVIAVHISGITPETFNRILSSVYKGEFVVTSDNMLDLWHASNHLQVDFLLKKLEDFIVINIADDNYFNIYTMALELASRKVKRSMHSFMAKNFNQISKTEDFLNLSYNCLQAIVEHGDLVLKSRDDLVIFVLKWIDYKPKSFDKKYFRTKQSDKHVVDKKHKVSHPEGKIATEEVNVIFKPRDEVTYKIESSSQRKDKLGDLMKIINLNDVSQKCLLMLLNNDDVMESREARTIVRQVFADRKDRNPTVRETEITKRRTKLLLDGSLDAQRFDFQQAQGGTVDVVVYLQTSFKAILAYVLDTRKTYSISRNGLPQDGNMKDVYSHKNQLYIMIGQSVGGREVCSIYKLQPNGAWECFTEVPGGSHSLMFRDNYMYCVFKFQLARLNMETPENLVWIIVYDIPNTATHVFMCGHKVLILHKIVTKIPQNSRETDTYLDRNYGVGAVAEFVSQSSIHSQYPGYKHNAMGYHNNPVWDCTYQETKNKNQKSMRQMATKFAYLDVQTWEYSEAVEWDCTTTQVELTEVKSFAANEKITAVPYLMDDVTFLLTKDGLLLCVSQLNPNSISVTQQENVFNWECRPTISGAVKQGNVLYLFVTPGPGLNVPQTPQLTSFDEMNVVQMLKTDSSIVPVSLPHQWLNGEIRI